MGALSYSRASSTFILPLSVRLAGQLLLTWTWNPARLLTISYADMFNGVLSNNFEVIWYNRGPNLPTGVDRMV